MLDFENTRSLFFKPQLPESAVDYLQQHFAGRVNMHMTVITIMDWNHKRELRTRLTGDPCMINPICDLLQTDDLECLGDDIFSKEKMDSFFELGISNPLLDESQLDAEPVASCSFPLPDQSELD
jgi:hypothetical protein